MQSVRKAIRDINELNEKLASDLQRIIEAAEEFEQWCYDEYQSARDYMQRLNDEHVPIGDDRRIYAEARLATAHRFYKKLGNSKINPYNMES